MRVTPGESVNMISPVTADPAVTLDSVMTLSSRKVATLNVWWANVQAYKCGRSGSNSGSSSSTRSGAAVGKLCQAAAATTAAADSALSHQQLVGCVAASCMHDLLCYKPCSTCCCWTGHVLASCPVFY
jgi:hypothetical protein